MLTRTSVTPDRQPLSHLGYVHACGQLAEAGGASARPWVQVRKRFGRDRVVLCGQVVEIDASSDSGEWFKVNTDLGPVWIESRNVRLCSGDGRCTCEAERSAGSADRERCPAPGAATRCETSRLERRPGGSIATA